MNTQVYAPWFELFQRLNLEAYAFSLQPCAEGDIKLEPLLE
jgi:hypothetical protein